MAWTGHQSGQKRHHDDNERLRFAQALEHRAEARAERFFTGFATIALPATIMDHDIALFHLACFGNTSHWGKIPAMGPLAPV